MTRPAVGILAALLLAAGFLPADDRGATGFVLADFNSSTDGWTSGPPPSAVPFDVPGFSRRELGIGALVMDPPNNTNTFGYWDSPNIQVPTVIKADRGMIPSRFRFEWDVYSEASSRDLTPTFRLRVSRPDFSETYIHVIESNAGGGYAPPTGIAFPDKTGPSTKGVIPIQAAKTYRTFVEQFDFNDDLRFSFDLLNFNGTDEAAPIGLEVVTSNYDPSPYVPISNTVLGFAGGVTNGFTFAGAPPLAPAVSEASASGLGLRAANTPTPTDSIIFGSWTGQPGVVLQGNGLYRVSWIMEAPGVAFADREKLPTFRLRANESSFQAAWFLNIDSTSPTARVPYVSVGNITYTLWFYAPEEADGEDLILSFDLIKTDADGNDPQATVFLRTLIIERLAIPL